jgi:hypothetical protein
MIALGVLWRGKRLFEEEESAYCVHCTLYSTHSNQTFPITLMYLRGSLYSISSFLCLIYRGLLFKL